LQRYKKEQNLTDLYKAMNLDLSGFKYNSNQFLVEFFLFDSLYLKQKTVLNDNAL